MGEIQETVIATYAHMVWNHKDLNVIAQTFHEKALIHSPLGDFQGISGMQEVINQWINAFPDIELNIIDTLVEGSKVVIQWEAQSTHTDTFLSIPATGQRIRYQGITVYRFEQLKVIEYWTYLNLHSLLSQLAIPVS